MVHDVLISLEFCVEVDPSILSESTHLMDGSEKGHEHLFFPALVAASPPNVFNEASEGCHILSWQLEVSENSFLSPRLLQAIILRLAAHHVFYHKRGSETVALSCNVWWNGIFWRSAKDVDVAVEITDNTVVQVLVIGRSKVSPEGLCKYLLVIVEDIFTTIHDLFPRLSGAVYMIHPVTPQMLLEKPRSRCPQEMFPIDFILESTRNGGSTCLSLDTESKAAICTPITEVFIGYEPPSDVIEGFLMSPTSTPSTNGASETPSHTQATTSMDTPGQSKNRDRVLVQMLLEKYEDRIHSDVASHAILKRLEVEGVIPGALAFKIEKEYFIDGNDMLFLHFKEHGDVETLCKFCDVLIKVGKDGYSKMHQTGQMLKRSISEHLRIASESMSEMDTPLDTPSSTSPLLTIPTLNQLEELIIQYKGVDWYKIGLQLNIKENVLKEIYEDCPHSEVACHTMFFKWLAHDNGTGGEPRVWRTVLKTLKNAGYTTFVGDVERELGL
jgi:putative heme iron utilization protein